MAITAYLDLDQGSDFSIVMELENDNSTPMNLSGFSVYSQFRKSYGSTVAHSFNAVVLNASQGTIKLSLSGIASSSIKPGRYLYDVEVTSDGVVSRIAEGIVTVTPQVTR